MIYRASSRAPLLYSRYQRTLFTAWQIPRRSPQLQLATGISYAWNLTSVKVCANCSVVRSRPSHSLLFPLPRLSFSLRKNTYTHTQYLQCREYILFISEERERERERERSSLLLLIQRDIRVLCEIVATTFQRSHHDLAS